MFRLFRLFRPLALRRQAATAPYTPFLVADGAAGFEAFLVSDGADGFIPFILRT